MEERTRTMNMLAEELDALKHQMEERGASMTDGSTLINNNKFFEIKLIIFP